MSRAEPVSRANLSAMQVMVAALPDAALLYGSNKELLAANDSGRAALAELATSADDPWGVADLSLDLLLHRVGSRPLATVVTELHDPNGAAIAELRAVRIGISPRTAAILVTISRRVPRGDVEGTRAALVARLLPGLAHEMRGPLTTISGLAQMLGSLAVLPHDVRQHVATVPNMVDRADELLRNVVSLVRPDRPETHLPSSVNNAVECASRLLAYELRMRGTQLTTELDRGLPLCDATPETLLHLMLSLFLSHVDSIAPTRALKVSTVTGYGRRIAIEIESEPFQPRSERLVEARTLLEQVGGKLRSLEATTKGRMVAELPALPVELLQHPRRRLLLAAHDLDRLLTWEKELATAARPVLLASSAAVALRAMARSDLGGCVLDLAVARRIESHFSIPTLVVASPGEEQAAAEFAEGHHLRRGTQFR